MQSNEAAPPGSPVSALVLGLALIAMGVLGLVELVFDPLLQDIDAGSADPGPAMFPRVLLMTLIAAGVGQCGIALAGAARRGFVRDAEFALARLAFPAVLVASLLVYAYALPRAGYTLATAVFALAWLALIGWRDRSLPASAAGVALVVVEAAVIVALLVAVFRYGIAVPLP